MRAAVVERPGVLTIKDVPEPVAGENDILLRVLTASICNATDNHILSGEFDGYHDHYPQVLGHEVCGEVVATGSKVHGVRIGERLVTYTPNGAFCEYTTVRASSAWARLPHAVSNDVAALCEMLHGALIGTVYPSGLEDGERVVVIGAGPLGLLTLQALKAMKDVQVGIIDRVGFRLDLARKLGADLTFDNTEVDVASMIEKITRDMGGAPGLVCVCTAADLSPDQSLYDFAARLTRPGGRLTGLNVDVKGLSHRVAIQDVFNRRILLARHLHPEVFERSSEHEIFQIGVDWVASGKVNLEDLITHRITLDQIEEGLRLCREALDHTLKVVVRIAG